MTANINFNNYRKAFTIVEISISILIISAIIVGITTLQSMNRKARLANARSLTQKSIVNDLNDDVVMWVESSLETSFRESERKKDNSNITIWKDNNKNLLSKNDAIAPTTTANQPKYYENLFYGSIPGVRFDGGQWLTFNSNKLIKSSYTIFVVEQRRSGQNQNYWIGGTAAAVNGNLHTGYRSNTGICIAHYGNDSDFNSVVPNYNNQLIPRIHTLRYNNLESKKYSLNGADKNVGSSGNNAPLQSFAGASIGAYHAASAYFIGDIAEIIIFKRSLKTEEIKAIENYLGSKYGITVS
jgi:hypothetical protein